MKNKKWILVLVWLPLVTSLVNLSACSGDDNDSLKPTDPEEVNQFVGKWDRTGTIFDINTGDSISDKLLADALNELAALKKGDILFNENKTFLFALDGNDTISGNYTYDKDIITVAYNDTASVKYNYQLDEMELKLTSNESVLTYQHIIDSLQIEAEEIAILKTRLFSKIQSDREDQ